MPSKCIANKKLKGRDGKEFIGLGIYGGKHGGEYIQGEVYPGDFLAKKWKHHFELVAAEAASPKTKPKKTPKDSSAGETDNEPAPTDSATDEGGNA